jgi:nitrite reductase/ring-hydroxylating ferredoxin subunit/multimeric flavodoxin WrbA
MPEARWVELGPVEELRKRPLQPVAVGRTKIALSYQNGQFGAVSGVCNHVGGPLGEGRVDGDYIVCPWHNWKYHCRTGEGEPGFEADRVPRYELKEEDGRLFVSLEAATKRQKAPHPPHVLERSLDRAPGGLRVAGISTTAMDAANPRYSTSEDLLDVALDQARVLGAETRLIRLNDLRFRHCEGYYSKSALACTWPCSITQMDQADQMDQVYDAFVFWADVVLISTSIRWGSASSLYFKMIERMNCIQNQITIRNRVMLRNKVAAFVITGGQDNVQAVAGEMLLFFSELGCHFPQFPFIAHSRGWSAEDMEENVLEVQLSSELRDGARALVGRSIDMANLLLGTGKIAERTERGGRKAHQVEPTAGNVRILQIADVQDSKPGGN